MWANAAQKIMEPSDISRSPYKQDIAKLLMDSWTALGSAYKARGLGELADLYSSYETIAGLPEMQKFNEISRIKIFHCTPNPNKKHTTFYPNPIANGRSYESMQGQIKKAPPLDDLSQWQLSSIMKSNRQQLEQGLLVGKIFVTILTYIAPIAFDALAPGFLTLSKASFDLASFMFGCFNAEVSAYVNSYEIKDDVEYALRFTFVDGDSSTMWLDTYFNKDNVLIARSKLRSYTQQ